MKQVKLQEVQAYTQYSSWKQARPCRIRRRDRWCFDHEEGFGGDSTPGIVVFRQVAKRKVSRPTAKPRSLRMNCRKKDEASRAMFEDAQDDDALEQLSQEDTDAALVLQFEQSISDTR